MSEFINYYRAVDGSNQREAKRRSKKKAKAMAKAKAKANPSEVKSEMMVNETTVGPFLHGEDIGHLLLKANFIPPRPYDPEKDKLKGVVVINNDEDTPGLEDLLTDIPDGYVPPKIVDRGPCLICDGPHSKLYCPLLDHCPFDQKLPEGYKITCGFCLSDVINGKCKKECGNDDGYVVDKVQMYYSLLKCGIMFQNAKRLGLDGKLT